MMAWREMPPPPLQPLLPCAFFLALLLSVLRKLEHVFPSLAPPFCGPTLTRTASVLQHPRPHCTASLRSPVLRHLQYAAPRRVHQVVLPP